MIEAYWDVATKRLVDNICMAIEHDFVNTVLRQLESDCFMLATEVGQKVSDLELLFSEDPTVQERRRNLFAKKERLSTALDTLRKMAPDCIAKPAPAVAPQRPGGLIAMPPPDPRAQRAAMAAAASGAAGEGAEEEKRRDGAQEIVGGRGAGRAGARPRGRSGGGGGGGPAPSSANPSVPARTQAGA
eukprot:CAMPEP_0205938662 /NCGR_PEP_ID=MMETSP1325-20131115/47543_1 /ASSEMBLY_ACC=CAM_ASM_000708 /TAXON_ID=236786 /ORGANISM="Florenciella sp., Strain RCC1007" /LENGTH=186 /DNA_ID=CAMNT_0053309025 /DNA_START=81 /DNA_END=637 /DNA_ORIENTATION=+